ncbi:iron(III) transport system permease protein [Ekhidna lutea]|uniref:Iron(III) transport system permease protein n=2 Tax=Ekhidna lutea TaxID=447679 RepID=A0A239KJE6_EKHLU|nr:iron(III) transport system permease protein [Ekhidna lutea]
MKLAGIKPPRHFYWRLATNCILALILLPLVLVASRSFMLDTSNLKHITTNLLPLYVWNTSILVIGTSAITLVLGVATAWFVTVYDFPFRKHFEWVLILPLAIPTFINAIAYVGLTDFAGPIRIFFRWLGTDIYLDIMNHTGAILIMSLVLYPYVYVTSRSAFLLQSSSLMEVSRSLGQSMRRTFFKVVLPLAWPAIFAGLILVIMEVLNDYGVVSYFGIPTFTVGIFRSWLALGDLSTAVFLSVIVLTFVVILLIIEFRANRKKRLTPDKAEPFFSRLKTKRKWLLFSICLLPVLAGFIIPVGQLLWWFFLAYTHDVWTSLFTLVGNTAILGISTTLIVAILSIILVYTFRLVKKKGVKKTIAKLPMLGYAMPGAVIAVGIVAFILIINPDLIYSSILALIFGYTVRFFAVGYGSIESGMEKIPSQIDDAAQSLGSNTFRNLIRVHLPVLKPVLLGALIMVFVDVAKELPITLILRPFNYETLATNAFQYAKDEMAPRSASSSLLIIFVSAIPVYYLNRILHRR